jgi:hypothetical protein
MMMSNSTHEFERLLGKAALALWADLPRDVQENRNGCGRGRYDSKPFGFVPARAPSENGASSTQARSVSRAEFVMNDVIDRILSTYQLMRPLDPDRVSDSRQRITRYIESLATAGQSDPEQLAVYGLAYLKELHEKRDPRFTGC